MAILRVHTVTINAADPWRLARFWATLVGGEPKDSGNDFVRVDPGGGAIPLLFQKADEVSERPGWIHLDCAVVDREQAIAQIEHLGGRLVERRADSMGTWVVMADPEGNPFCT